MIVTRVYIDAYIMQAQRTTHHATAWAESPKSNRSVLRHLSCDFAPPILILVFIDNRNEKAVSRIIFDIADTSDSLHLSHHPISGGNGSSDWMPFEISNYWTVYQTKSHPTASGVRNQKKSKKIFLQNPRQRAKNAEIQ